LVVVDEDSNVVISAAGVHKVVAAFAILVTVAANHNNGKLMVGKL
jgi:hypothetical protein